MTTTPQLEPVVKHLDDRLYRLPARSPPPPAWAGNNLPPLAGTPSAQPEL